jgi:hypothetical protein
MVVILWNELGNDYSVIYKSSIILTISNKSHRDSGLVQQRVAATGRDIRRSSSKRQAESLCNVKRLIHGASATTSTKLR